MQVAVIMLQLCGVGGKGHCDVQMTISNKYEQSMDIGSVYNKRVSSGHIL